MSFGESANFPLLLGAVLVLCGVATLAHLLAVSVRRRRRENGLLSSLGFVHGQLAGVMFWDYTGDPSGVLLNSINTAFYGNGADAGSRR